MKSTRKDGNVESAEARDALRRILDSGFLSNSPKLEEFLRFVTNEEFEGRGEAICPHAIAVSALGRRESFDPKADPVVRVFASRLRTALSAYYEGKGSDDPVRIEIPRGSYRPFFLKADDETSRPATPQTGSEPPRSVSHRKPITTRQLNVLTGLLAAAVLVIGAAIFHLAVYYPSDKNAEAFVSQGSRSTTHVPVVEILPFDADAADSVLIESIRQQLIVDLSEFRTLRVRQMSRFAPTGKAGAGLYPTSDYRIEGSVTGTNGGAKLELLLRDATSGKDIWSDVVELPANDAEYQDLVLTAIRSIVPRLAGISGVIRAEAIARLERRHDNLGNRETSDYECIIKFYAYDLRKTAKLEAEARKCLSNLTTTGSRDSTVWSSWALMQYLDWARLGDPRNLTPLQEALKAAEKATNLDPADANAHEIKAMIYTMLAEKDAALKCFRLAFALNPSKPDLYFHFGGFYIFFGNWQLGIDMVRAGITMSPNPPGWMRIPLSLDAFRRDDYLEALQQAQLVIASGDKRAVVLALAAAIAMNDQHLVLEYNTDLLADKRYVPEDPMREFRLGFPDPKLIAKYKKILSGITNQ